MTIKTLRSLNVILGLSLLVVGGFTYECWKSLRATQERLRLETESGRELQAAIDSERSRNRILEVRNTDLRESARRFAALNKEILANRDVVLAQQNYRLEQLRGMNQMSLEMMRAGQNAENNLPHFLNAANQIVDRQAKAHETAP